MANTQEQPASSYLIALLGAGARPFGYRSGVYQLLGQTPPHQTPMRGAPPLPPVGFQYAHTDVEHGPGQSMEASTDTINTALPPQSAMGLEARNAVGNQPLIRETNLASAPDTVEAKQAVAPTFLPADATARMKSGAASNQQVTDNLAGDGERVDKMIPNTSLANTSLPRAAELAQPRAARSAMPGLPARDTFEAKNRLAASDQDSQKSAYALLTSPEFTPDGSDVSKASHPSGRSVLNAAHLPAAVQQILAQPTALPDEETPALRAPEMMRRAMPVPNNRQEAEAGDFRFASQQQRTTVMPIRSGSNRSSQEKTEPAPAKQAAQAVSAQTAVPAPQPIQEVVYLQPQPVAVHQSPRAAKASSKLRSRHLRTLR